MTDFMRSIAALLQQGFHNEFAMVSSLSSLGQVIYAFYAVAAILVIRPHIRQAMKYRHGEAGKGDFCHHAQYEAIFWRFAPLLYAFVIDSKLLALSVVIDIVGRLWTIYESHQAEKRFKKSNPATHLHQDEASTNGMDLFDQDVLMTKHRRMAAHRETAPHGLSCACIPGVAHNMRSTLFNVNAQPHAPSSASRLHRCAKPDRRRVDIPGEHGAIIAQAFHCGGNRGEALWPPPREWPLHAGRKVRLRDSVVV